MMQTGRHDFHIVQTFYAQCAKNFKLRTSERKVAPTFLQIIQSA
jgi:hypothetical protein